MNQSHPALIYDVGLFDGEDTAYYLFRGYNVVAVDANPLMVERAGLRFAEEIRTKRLTLLNAGISETRGTGTFWISDRPEWSSFDRSIASRAGTAHRPVDVATVPFSHILTEHGIPYYLKIDIEGNDRLCLEALKGTNLPQFISVESECEGDASGLSDRQATAMLELLRDIGYRKFKLVNQEGWTSVRFSNAARVCMRLINSASRGRLRIRGLARIANRLSDAAKIEALGFPFSAGSSGPWGDDIPGSWMKFESARSAFLREWHAADPCSFWCDWHATY